MKKKDFLYSAMAALCMACTLSACSDDSDEPNPGPDPKRNQRVLMSWTIRPTMQMRGAITCTKPPCC